MSRVHALQQAYMSISSDRGLEASWGVFKTDTPWIIDVEAVWTVEVTTEEFRKDLKSLQESSNTFCSPGYEEGITNTSATLYGPFTHNGITIQDGQRLQNIIAVDVKGVYWHVPLAKCLRIVDLQGTVLRSEGPFNTVDNVVREIEIILGRQNREEEHSTVPETYDNHHVEGLHQLDKAEQPMLNPNFYSYNPHLQAVWEESSNTSLYIDMDCIANKDYDTKELEKRFNDFSTEQLKALREVVNSVLYDKEQRHI